jgi:hypothetical protein
MSYLLIRTQTKAKINPEFCKAFITMSEGMDSPFHITHMNPFIDHNPDTQGQEATDVQNMAIFMLLSNELVGVKWGDKYYFGDSDRMDMEEGFDEQDATVLQYCFEDRDTKIIAEMACVPANWMYAGTFEDRFAEVYIETPDKIVFVLHPDTLPEDVESLCYDIENHFIDMDIDYHTIETA